MADTKSSRKKELITYFLFCLVCAASNWAVYILLTKLLRVDLSATGSQENMFLSLFRGEADINIKKLFVCTVSAWIVNVIVAFITNKIWVFKSKEKSVKGILREFATFFGGHFFTGVLDWAGTPLLVMLGLNQSLLGIEGALAKLIISILIMVLNYIINKLVVFKKKAASEGNADVQQL